MFKTIFCTLALICAGNAWAGPYDPIVSAAWIGESVPGQTTATLQLNITTVKAIKLLAVRSPLADNVEIHSVVLRKGKVTPQVVSSISLPERRTSSFGSKNLFLMMTGIRKTLNVGDQIPISMHYSFSDGKTRMVEATAEVKKMELSYKHYGSKEVYDHR